MGINFKTYQKVRTIIRFSSKFTILPILYLQTICHLFTIIYYGTSLQRSHVISHTLKLNHITQNVSCAHAYRGLFTRTRFRSRVNRVCADGHRGKMHCARAVFLLLVNAPLLKTIGKNNKLGFRPRILKNLSSRHQT